jgi:hypothetical protein
MVDMQRLCYRSRWWPAGAPPGFCNSTLNGGALAVQYRDEQRDSLTPTVDAIGMAINVRHLEVGHDVVVGHDLRGHPAVL